MSLVEVNLKCAKCIDTGEYLSQEDEWVEAVKKSLWDSEQWTAMITVGTHRGKLVAVREADMRESIPELLRNIREKASELHYLLSMNTDRLQEKTSIPVMELMFLLDQVKEGKELDQE